MKVIIVGAGPTGLFTCDQLLRNSKDIEVKLFDRMNSPGNKFLIAGKSGLNLTHSSEMDKFISNYFNNKDLFKSLLEDFSNGDLVDWAHELGVETFVGSSGRVFPKTFKAARFLKLWLDRLKSYDNFTFYSGSEVESVSNQSISINGEELFFDKLVLALGGASWKNTGSNGEWVNFLKDLNVKVNDFKSLNCGFNTAFSFDFVPLKYVKVSYENNSILGDVMLTKYGIEGSPIYYLSHFLNDKHKPSILIDLVPDHDLDFVNSKLSTKKSMSTKLKSFLDENKVLFLKKITTKDEFHSIDYMSKILKNISLQLDSARDIDEAISTSGGVCLSELSNGLFLKNYNNIYLGGEMLDWDAPTGGFLLQGCFSQGFRIAKSILNKKGQ